LANAIKAKINRHSTTKMTKLFVCVGIGTFSGNRAVSIVALLARIAANIAKLPAAHHITDVMARRRNITQRFGIEDEILAAPIVSISDIATKLEIITARAKLFDVSDDLERLHDQIVAFRAGESLAPEPWNWHAT
jgi:hypothetical protein